MKLKLIDNTGEMVHIAASGNITSGTSKRFYEEVADICDDLGTRDLILNCEAVNYISSQGIHNLLALNQQFPGTLKLMHLQPKVYDVLVTTGINTVLPCERLPEEISLEGCRIIGKGSNGTIYRLDRDRIAKMYPAGTSYMVPTDEVERARQAFLLGLPTAVAYGTVTSNGMVGAVYELVHAETLSEYITGHPEEFDRMAREYVKLLRHIHSITTSDEKLPDCKETYRQYISELGDWYSPEELDALRRFLDYIPDGDTLLHGDYHANNIMVVDGELVLIDMVDMSNGHPAFDFLNTAATQANLVDLNPEYAEHHTRMPVKYIKMLWSTLLERYFVDLSAEELKEKDRLFRLMSKFKVGLAPIVGAGLPEELIRASVDDAKKNFIPYIDTLKGRIDF